jgi:hypothetical protein
MKILPGFSGLLLLLPTLLSAAPGRVVFEAETAIETELPMFVVGADRVPAGSVFVEGASGGQYLEIPENAGNPPKLEKGFARFEIDVPADGEYTLWARVWWEGECSNSFMVQIDENAPFLLGENATYHAWVWVKYPVARMMRPITLKQGRHAVTFKNREDGVRLDQIVLSPDKRFVPVDIEQVTTTGSAL